MRNILNLKRVLTFLSILLTFTVIFSCNKDSAEEMPYFGGNYEGEIILSSVATPWEKDSIVVNELKKDIKVRVDGKYICIYDFPAGELYAFYFQDSDETLLNWTANYKIPYEHGGEKRAVEELFLNPQTFEMKVRNFEGKKADLNIYFRDNHKCILSGNSLQITLWLYNVYITGNSQNKVGRPALSVELKLNYVEN